MSDEERREAKRLWRLSGGESGTRLENYLAGYAAACEAKRETLALYALERADAIEQADRDAARADANAVQIGAERARSAKLIMTLQHIRANGDAQRYVTEALQEYEASK